MVTTLRDVAAAAGVSVKTVSNVVNGYVHVTPQMRARVEEAIAELDYRPNIAARNLRKGRTGLIALAVPSLRNAYFAELAQLIVETAAAHELTVLVDATAGDLDEERRVCDGLGTGVVDAIILCPHAITPADVRARRSQTPLVLLSEQMTKAADSVAIDSRAAAREATQHLLGLGRRRLGVIGFEARPSGRTVAKRRLDGFRDALTADGVDFDPDTVVSLPRGSHADEAGQAARDLLERHPDLDGLFCFNDEFALGAVSCLLGAGWRVPEDVAVIGIDDIDAGRLCSPSLSTIAPDKRSISETALAMLDERMAGSEADPRHVVAGFSLVARESTTGQARRRGQLRRQR